MRLAFPPTVLGCRRAGTLGRLVLNVLLGFDRGVRKGGTAESAIHFVSRIAQRTLAHPSSLAFYQVSNGLYVPNDDAWILLLSKENRVQCW